MPSISQTPLLIWGNEEHPNTIIGGRRELEAPPMTLVRPAEERRSGIVCYLKNFFNLKAYNLFRTG